MHPILNLFHRPKPTPVGAILWAKYDDIHSHILPGVDDGSDAMEVSLQMIRQSRDSGVRLLCATPHIRDGWRTSPRVLRQIMDELQARKKEARIEGIELHLAAEYLLDEFFMEALNSGDILPLPGNRVLVETSFYEAPFNMDQILFQIQLKGFTPVLAHPERYAFLLDNPSAAQNYRNKGYLFQLDLLSLQGAYGMTIRKQALKMLRMGMIDLVGSDMHTVEQARLLGQFLHDPQSAPLATLL